ncbi:hypothetical protein WJX72_009388 [[Myrmecia] bisecta]|uniref:Uncharacterized protein n=1 Tax=[Myrmecia] bisecta TaxID=41462 RepID=A0AAW1PSG0_9CHLO
MCSAVASRRFALLAGLSLTGLLPDQRAPESGDCADCIGPSDGTLSSCGDIQACSSTFDDRPSYFVAPWEYEGSQDNARESLEQAISAVGGHIQQRTNDYIYATVEDWTGTQDMEFLFADSDQTVALRSACRLHSLPDGGSRQRRLEGIRRRLQWQQVPILRNRQRKFLFLESPWDTFGPVPPPDPTYENVDDPLL